MHRVSANGRLLRFSSSWCILVEGADTCWQVMDGQWEMPRALAMVRRSPLANGMKSQRSEPANWGPRDSRHDVFTCPLQTVLNSNTSLDDAARMAIM
ncbi:hypothetical protein JAAARDRAFT_480777 [Jaapia argillacea MUCL 33604]|uniref:Uncharacterized protein n=1 Tax=Jaapia argillacea MUCL 33604 TaxID=933084 RepID=A0A067PMS6_9AGAM|nr:hypothetical protein JAAARDRAFT_480777 [Jaapia argillacea MUCL 33604]